MAAAMSEVVTADTSGIFPLDLKVGFKVYAMSRPQRRYAAHPAFRPCRRSSLRQRELVSGRASIQNIAEVIATNGIATGPHSQRSATE